MSGQFKVLLVASRPKELATLPIKEQIMKIRSGVAELGKHIQLDVNVGAEFADLPRLLLQTQPDILHVAVHGSEQGLLAFEDAEGRVQAIPIDAFKKLLSAFAKCSRLPCVVLNACYMGELAQSLTESVGYVIASPYALLNSASVQFSGVFYQMLVGGLSVEQSFEIAHAVSTGTGGDGGRYVLYKSAHQMTENESARNDLRKEYVVKELALGPKKLNKLLFSLLPLGSDFDAFCLDNFPDLYRNFSSAMERQTKHNLLFTAHKLPDIINAAKLYEPKKFAKVIDEILREE